ncbi:MAG: acetamidase/formamidase family protein [Gammaproteobacteria bacterium]
MSTSKTGSRREFFARSSAGLAGAFLAQGVSSRIARAADASARSVTAAAPDGPVLRWVPKHEELCYTFGGVSARKHIKSGTRIVTWTEDCFDGNVKTAADLLSKVLVPGHDNPQTGPFYVEGAEHGDTLAIRILKLEPARSYAVSAFSPGFGAMVGNDRTAMLGTELPEATWRYDVDAKRNVARTTSGDGKHFWEVPLAPFLGCLGVAPAEGEVRSTTVPGPFGGNMDCPEVRVGNTVYLGVNMPGALLSFGDAHYAMGDGEIIGGAIEGAMNVEVIVDLLKGVSTPVPRIENEHEIMFVGSGRPLEDAARVAFKAMIGWVRQTSGLSEVDAYQFVSQNAQAPIIQLVDPEYTVMVKIARSRLPGVR